MDEIQKMIEAFSQKQRDVMDSELSRIPTSVLPAFIDAFENVAAMAKKELEFRKLRDKLE